MCILSRFADGVVGMLQILETDSSENHLVGDPIDGVLDTGLVTPELELEPQLIESISEYV